MQVRIMYGKNVIDRAIRVEAELGRGGGGAVYKAWHSRLEKYVVIKQNRRGSETGADRARNEFKALKSIKCAYLPNVFDFVDAGANSYTVMEFIEGESFDKLLGHGRVFTVAQVLKWYGQLAAALDAVHRYDTCHCDIKPANIMLTPNGDVRLIDFNAAYVEGERMGAISRSPGYASPEQYEIFELYKKALSTKAQSANALCVHASPDGGEEVIRSGHDGETALLVGDSATEFTENAAPPAYQGENAARPVTEGWGVDWKRSDVYSLGATIYHIYTGKHPPFRTDVSVKIRSSGAFDEGLLYLIEKSMQLNPSSRFASAAVLANTIQSIIRDDTKSC